MKAIRSMLTIALLSALPVTGALQPKVTFSGNLKLSVDASGSNTGTATIRAEKPSVNATVHAAYLLAASTGFTGYAIKAGDIKLDGASITFTDSLANSISSLNYWTDVSLNVRPKLNTAPAGIVNFTVTELVSVTTNIDGEILAVIWDEPSAPPTTISLLFGAQSTTGDSFTVSLASPVDKTNPATVLDMSLGISYGFQPAGQYSILSLGINGTRISSSAGGYDDGQPANGALITAGGIGDMNDNPPDPLATDLTCRSAAGLPAPRCDDELYNLLPFVSNGATSFTVSTLNPSNDDNIFFAAIVLGANTASVGEGITLTPASGSSATSTAQTVNAHVQSITGNPISGRSVAFKVISGPNVGLTGSVSTNSGGDALFSFTSTVAGIDTIQGCMTNTSGVLQCSNQVTRTWTGTNNITYSFVLTPPFVSSLVGSGDTITATILDNSGAPVSGIPVSFTVLAGGPNMGLTGSDTTNSAGKAFFTYSSATAGTDLIRASALLGGVSQNSNSVSAAWTAPSGNPVILLSPLTSTNPVNGQDTLTAIAYNTAGFAASGVTVSFTALSGPNAGSLGTAVTNSLGIATRSYIGHSVGTDNIRASATLDSIATQSNTVTSNWSGLLCDLDNNGQVDVRDISLVFAARNTLVGPGDPRDANFDGKVDALDLRACTLLCSKAGCAQ